MFYVETTLGRNAVGGYVLSIGSGVNGNIFDFDLSQYDLSGSRIFAHILRENGLEFDSERYVEIVAEEQRREQERPATWEESLEAQVTYTALMTDTLLEE